MSNGENDYSTGKNLANDWHLILRGSLSGRGRCLLEFSFALFNHPSGVQVSSIVGEPLSADGLQLGEHVTTLANSGSAISYLRRGKGRKYTAISPIAADELKYSKRGSPRAR